jgi:nucleotide-binding universal stress UspA family protein
VPAQGADSGPHVVVGHDGHAGAHVALVAAVDLALRIGAHLHVVHSVTVADYGVDPDTEEFEASCVRNLVQEREFIARTLLDVGVPWTYHEERGEPAVRLAQLAAELNAYCIVVGASHRGRLHLGGSVPKRLLHVQKLPVVVVPDPQQRHRHGRRERAGTAPE